MFDSLFEVGDVLSFQSGQVVQSVNDLNSEFVQGVHNLSDDSLVAEVLVRSQGDQGFDHWGHSGLGVDFSFNLLQGVLEFLDLDH